MNFKFIWYIEILLLSSPIVHSKFSLLYPSKGTTYKWIFGFGVPIDDLVLETITSGMVWRFQFRLPSTVADLKHRTVTKLGRNLDKSQNPIPYLWDEEDNKVQQRSAFKNSTQINALELKSYALSNYRWGVYKSLEGVAERMGLNGRDCMLKSICETAEDPLHFGNGLWAELVHILLTPSSSVDTLSEHSDNEYYYAEHMGRSAGGNCERVFKHCSRSLLDHFSNFYKLTDELAKFW